MTLQFGDEGVPVRTDLDVLLELTEPSHTGIIEAGHRLATGWPQAGHRLAAVAVPPLADGLHVEGKAVPRPVDRHREVARNGGLAAVSRTGNEDEPAVAECGLFPAEDASVHLGLFFEDVLDDMQLGTIARHGINMRVKDRRFARQLDGSETACHPR